MLPEIGGFPSRGSGMAFIATCGKTSSKMVRDLRLVIVGFMTGITIGRSTGIISILVAGTAIINGMSLGEGKESVVEVGPGPGERGHLVTLAAINCEAGQQMVRLCGGFIVSLVAVVTFNSQCFEL
jgi:hypothetical protein